MKLTDAEKLSLTMLAEIHAKLGIEDGINAELVAGAIYNGQTWALDWEYGDVLGFTDRSTTEEANEVASILDMWDYVEGHIEQLTLEDRERLIAAIGQNDIAFPGFDGNHDRQYGIARYMVNDYSDGFARFKKRDLNSHSQSTLPRSRKMLAAFNSKIRDKHSFDRLTTDDIIDVINAQ